MRLVMCLYLVTLWPSLVAGQDVELYIEAEEYGRLTSEPTQSADNSRAVSCVREVAGGSNLQLTNGIRARDLNVVGHDLFIIYAHLW